MSNAHAEYLNEEKALEFLKDLGIPMSRPTFLQIRRGGGLAFSKVAGRYFYRIDDLRSFLNQIHTKTEANRNYENAT